MEKLNPDGRDAVPEVVGNNQQNPNAYMERQERSLGKAVDLEQEELNNNYIRLGTILHGDTTPEGVKKGISSSIQRLAKDLGDKHFVGFSGLSLSTLASTTLLMNANLGSNAYPVLAGAITTAVLSFIKLSQMIATANIEKHTLSSLKQGTGEALEDAKLVVESLHRELGTQG